MKRLISMCLVLVGVAAFVACADDREAEAWASQEEALAVSNDRAPVALRPDLRIAPGTVFGGVDGQEEDDDDGEKPVAKCHELSCGRCNEVDRSYTGTYLKTGAETNDCPQPVPDCDVRSRGMCGDLNGEVQVLGSGF